MRIYYGVTAALHIAFIFAFHESIQITEASLIPLALIGLMIFQAAIFRSEKAETGSRTAYGSRLSEEEENTATATVSRFLYATIPWMIPFVLFFSSPVKFLSAAVYVIGFVSGFLLYRCKNKRAVLRRVNEEERRRQEQEEKEQLGKWR